MIWRIEVVFNSGLRKEFECGSEDEASRAIVEFSSFPDVNYARMMD